MNTPDRKKYQPKDCFDAIAAFHAQTGQISSSAYTKWRVKNKNYPSIMCIYSTIGKWKTAVETMSIVKSEEPELKPVVTKQLCKKALRVFFIKSESFTAKEYQKWQKDNTYFPTLSEINIHISWKEYKKQLTRNAKLYKKEAAS